MANMFTHTNIFDRISSREGNTRNWIISTSVCGCVEWARWLALFMGHSCVTICMETFHIWKVVPVCFCRTSDLKNRWICNSLRCGTDTFVHIRQRQGFHISIFKHSCPTDSLLIFIYYSEKTVMMSVEIHVSTVLAGLLQAAQTQCVVFSIQLTRHPMMDFWGPFY